MHATPEPFRRSQSLPVAIHLHRVPIVAYQFPGWWASALPSCLGTFSAPGLAAFSARLSPGFPNRRISVSRLLGPAYGPSALLLECSKTAFSGMHATPVSFRSRQNPLAADLHRQVLTPIEHSVLPQASSGRSGLTSLSNRFHDSPGSSLSASRHPERWREPHYSAFDRYRRCNSAACWVCMLPLMRPGRISAPWPPTTCARFPSRSLGALIFLRRMPCPDKRLSPHGSQARMSHSAFFECGSSAAADSGMSATPADYGAAEPPDRHLPASGTQQLWKTREE